MVRNTTWFGIMCKIPNSNVARLKCEEFGEFRAFYRYGALWEAWIRPDGKVELECKEKAGSLRDAAVKQMNDELYRG